jgi:hypothetical protein
MKPPVGCSDLIGLYCLGLSVLVSITRRMMANRSLATRIRPPLSQFADTEVQLTAARTAATV